MQNYSILDAFKALEDINDDFVEKEIKVTNKKVTKQTNKALKESLKEDKAEIIALDISGNNMYDRGQAYFYARTGDCVDINGVRFKILEDDTHKIGYSDEILLKNLATGETTLIAKKDFIKDAQLLNDCDESLKEEAMYGLFVKVKNSDTNEIIEAKRQLMVGTKKECEDEKKHLEEVSNGVGNHINIYTVEFLGNSNYDNPSNPDKVVKESCELKEEPQLEPKYDARKSFYGKADVETKPDGTQILYSYNTPVAMIKDGKVTLGKSRLRGYPIEVWNYSQTTLRHVKEFLKQNGFKADSASQLEKDYECDFINECIKEAREPKIEYGFETYDLETKKPVKHNKDEERLPTKEEVLKALEENGILDGQRVINVDELDEAIFDVLDAYVDDNFGKEHIEAYTPIWDRLWKEIDKIARNILKEHKVRVIEESLTEARGKGFVCKYKGYSIIDVGDRYVITNKNGLNVGESKFGLPVVKGIIDDLAKNESLTEEVKLDLMGKDVVEKGREALDKQQEERVEQIVDVDAESIEDLKDSYVGDIIVKCNKCGFKFFRNKEDLIKDEETGFYNIDEECTHCGAKEGFSLVGQVATLDVNAEDADEQELPNEEVPEEQQEEEPKQTTEISKENVEVKNFGENLSIKKPKTSVITNESLDNAKLIEGLNSFDEKHFDTLVNKYFNKLYENVESYTTTNCTLDNDNIIVEGTIKFKSGKEKNTTFKVCESKILKANKVKFNCINETLTKQQNAFRVLGEISDKEFIPECLVCDYKVAKLNEELSVRERFNIKDIKSKKEEVK